MSKLIKVREFYYEKTIEFAMNKWLAENIGIRIIDVKYTANGFGSHALVIYQEGEEDE